MPRGGHKVKPAKVESNTPTLSRTSSVPVVTTTTKSDWKSNLLAPSFRSRSASVNVLSESVNDQPTQVRDSSRQPTIKLDIPTEPIVTAEANQVDASTLSAQLSEYSIKTRSRASSRASSIRSIPEEEPYDGSLDTCQDLTIDTTVSSISSSIYSKDSSSIYSRASSIYSSGASIYSFEDAASADQNSKENEVNFESRQLPQRARTVAVRKQEVQDAAARERSTLARKAALFKNSRLAPELPSFNTTLPKWAMVCRAAQASKHCYSTQAQLRRGSYTAADTSKDIKAMIVDEQYIDDARVIIVAICGTESQSLSDWAVNTSHIPTKPTGFLDDVENACHTGFLSVTKAMVAQVALQLKQHPATSEKPSLLFTGHSAGGAVAALLYSHMISTSVQSSLTALAGNFPSINCVTFGAPPVSLTPLLKRDHVPGMFLGFANEGDLVLRTSNAAYFKSLAKLMTASPPQSATVAVAPPPVKVVRGSRGATVYRPAAPVAPPTPWEELPLWPTPAPSTTNAGDLILLRDREDGCASASRITVEDLKEVIFGDLAEHSIGLYMRRVKEMALAAMSGTI